MRFKDWIDTLPEDANALGVVLSGPDLPKPMALRYVSPGLAWFVLKETYPNGKMTFVHGDPSLSPIELLADYEVIELPN